jgi:hypothetical protein
VAPQNTIALLPSTVADLAHCLMVTEAAFEDHKDDLIAILNLVNGDEFLPKARWNSPIWHPSYCIAYDTRLEPILLSLSGSKEIAAIITNLSCDKVLCGPSLGSCLMVTEAAKADHKTTCL